MHFYRFVAALAFAKELSITSCINAAKTGNSFFNLKDDPGETENLIGVADFADAISRHRNLHGTALIKKQAAQATIEQNTGHEVVTDW